MTKRTVQRRKRLAPEQRKELIVQCARTMFAKHGYDATSVSAIASASGISKPIVYDHFASKQALFGAVLTSTRDELLVLANAGSGRVKTPRKRFSDAVRTFFQYADDHPEAIRVLLITPQSNEEAAVYSRGVQAGATQGIAALLGGIWPGQSQRTLLLSAEFVKSGMHALARLRLQGTELSADDATTCVVQLTWNGLASLSRAASKARISGST